MMTLLARWLVNAAALVLIAYFYPGVELHGWGPALIAALVLGFVNALVRPILIVLTLPVTILTLGLFIFVINALLFWFVAEIVHGFAVTGFGAALVGSILYSILTLITSRLLFPRGN